MFGMTEKEFWEDDPQLYWSYQTFYLKKQNLDMERDNQYMWLQGMYIYEGFSIALNNAFAKQKKPYRDEPYKLNNENEKGKTTKEIDDYIMKQNNTWSRII